MRHDLDTLQQTFANALFDANAVEQVLATFKGDKELTQRRFAHYRSTMLSNWSQACRSAYPVLCQVVGDDFFNELVRHYGLTQLSLGSNLNEFGEDLPRFISTLTQCEGYPYFEDVAKLEWLVHHSYYKKQRAPLSIQHLSVVAPEQLMERRLRWQDSCALFQSSWAVGDIWLAHQEVGLALPHELARPNYCLIWRPFGLTSWKVQVSVISAASYFALQALVDGHTLGDALELALEVDSAFDIQTELLDWLSKGLFFEQE